jgi:integrase
MVAMATVTKRRWKTSTGEAREAWHLAFTDSSGARHKSQHATKREAEAARIKAEGQVVSGTFRAEASKVAVADACQLYLDHLETRHGRDARVTTTYLATVRGEVWNYIAPSLRPANHDKIASRVTPFTAGVGETRLAQLSASAVGSFRDRMLRAGVTVSTARRILATLARVLGHAIENDLVAVNAARGVRVVGRRDEGPKKVTPPAKALMTKLLTAADSDFRLRVLFACRTGLRASEQWGLRWNRVDLAGRALSVASRVDVYGDEGPTKSTAGQRTVRLGKDLVAALTELHERAAPAAGDLVFPSRGGGFVRHGNMIKRQFDPLAAGIGHPELTWHALRHYAVSAWIESGLPPKVVQTYAGHATLAITMDRYGHMFPSASHADAMDWIADNA